MQRQSEHQIRWVLSMLDEKKENQEIGRVQS